MCTSTPCRSYCQYVLIKVQQVKCLRNFHIFVIGPELYVSKERCAIDFLYNSGQNTTKLSDQKALDNKRVHIVKHGTMPYPGQNLSFRSLF